MPAPTIHLIAPAGACRPFLDAMNIDSADGLMAIVRGAVGAGYSVTGNATLIEAGENERMGGRDDDRLRAEDLQRALGSDNVAAIVLLRGGAWFTRILPHVDFDVLAKRTSPVAVFGFSELTTLVNIVGAAENGLGVYDMGPAFLTYGLKRHAYVRENPESDPPARPGDWASAHLRPQFDAFFRDVTSIIEGRGTRRPIAARLVEGEIPDRLEATFVGGNLTVLSTLVGTRFDSCVRPDGRWLVIEDFNDKLERADRFLAHLTLADYWDRCEGVLVGDFHQGYEDLVPAVLKLLKLHIPEARTVPILTTRDVGHIWPMSPLPLHIPLTIERRRDDAFSIHWNDDMLRTV